MKTFRYKTMIRKKTNLIPERELNELGSKGWELASFAMGITEAVYIFKKEDRIKFKIYPQ